jgi:hypothetical protein
MGYCVVVEHSNIAIDKNNVDKAIRLLGELMEEVSCFSWVGTKTVKDCLERNDLVGALREWRYCFHESKDGDVSFNWFTGEKWGDDERLWAALAPVIDATAVIVYRGEDGNRWRYSFNGTNITEQSGQTVWV